MWNLHGILSTIILQGSIDDILLKFFNDVFKDE